MNLSEATELAVISIASKTMYGGSTAAIVGWITKTDLLSLVGAIVAVLGLIGNIYYRHRKDKREQAEHEIRMREITVEYQARRNLIKQGIDPDEEN